MNINGENVGSNEDGLYENDEVATLVVPECLLSTLVDMLAIAKSCMCDGNAVSNKALCGSFESLEQLIYKQMYEVAGPDAVWRDPNDGSFHHPTFPEQDGEAWEAYDEASREWFEMRLVETLTEVLAERDKRLKLASSCAHEQYEHMCKDIIEAHGPKGLLRAMMA